MRLIRDDDHVRPLAQHRVIVFRTLQRKLLDRRENDPAGFPGRQHLAELFAALRLLRRLLEQILRAAKLLEKLAIQIIAIRHHHQRRVVHLRLLKQLPGVAAHRD